ncbi:TetR/AcrR family transcriptional regulator [Clostridium kluyveri]|uniref:Transcriptional regulator n=1 Tax=Clostridium kluyveri TaxID=1534 RepID=A0A1L5F9J0_CLOKL|nr:TetR/AcrR family transcriptional regulator [Clostridium kluyveri]APM39652.1 transcriptional regulator [Clostridium kluyveri]UZQ50191.1 TetR/AcrR family transcriptional regulator [Clostridium kluyveri]
MEEKKLDRRIRKTKQSLFHALTKLMSKKKINNITVKELTDLADVNRSTFYHYYRDIFDMVDKIRTEFIDDFSKTYDKFSKEATTYDDLLSFFIYIFEFVQINAGIFKIFLCDDMDYTFIEKLKDAIKHYEIPLDDTSSELEAHYCMPFIISGCIGVIQQWLNNDMNASPKDMASIIVKML